MVKKGYNKLANANKSNTKNAKVNKKSNTIKYEEDLIESDNESDMQDELGNISFSKSYEDDEVEEDEEVFNLNDDNEDNDDDDDDSDDDNELKNLINNLAPDLRSKILSNLPVQSDSDDDNEISNKSNDWGKKKSYYSGDVADLEIGQDFEDAEEEEETAKELLQEKYGKLKESDFFEDDDDNINIDDYIKKNNKLKRKDKLLGDLETIALGKSDGVTEEIDRDMSKLTDEQRIALIQAESPELPLLLEDLQEKLEDLKSKIEPIKALFDELPEHIDSSDDIVQYLEMKQQIMLSYCTNIVFYLYMKSIGQSVKNHPVMKQLLEHRYFMEKLRPLDGKLKYQIDRLVKLSNQSDRPTSDDIKSALLRPNPDNLIDDDDEEKNNEEDEDIDENVNDNDEEDDENNDVNMNDDNSDIEDDIEEENTKLNTKYNKTVIKEPVGVYKPPRFQPMVYHDKDSKEEEKLLKEIQKKKKKLRNNVILESLEEEFGDRPEGVSSSGLTVINTSEKELQDEENERRDFEEDRFVRLTMTRKEKKERKMKEISANRLDDLSNIDNIDDIEELSELLTKSNKNNESNDSKNTRDRSNNENNDNSNISSKLLEKFMSNYSNDKTEKSEGRRKAPDSNHNETLDSTNNLLEQFTLKKKQFLLDKKKHYEPEPRYGSVIDEVNDNEMVGKKRAATYEMITNRGLTPHRNKINRNARVKKRVKYDQAKIRLKGAHRTMRVGESDRYIGETTGIKSTVSRISSLNYPDIHNLTVLYSDMSNDINDQSSDDSGEQDDIIDINSETIRYNQMRKKHEPKNNLKAYQIIDEEFKDNTNERMLEGIKQLLYLHSPYELSAICGQLDLSSQQKGPVSMNLIMKFINSSDSSNNNDNKTPTNSNINKSKINKHKKYESLQLRIKRVLYCMWEGAMFEYLRCIGHPTSTIFRDPRETILRIWLDGGVIDNGTSFIPHFAVRHVHKRYDNELSQDIKEKLEPIKLVQERVKIAERRIIVDQDYTCILNYLQLMGKLRALENDARDYFISEIEIGRSHIQSCENTSNMYIEQLYECETQSTAIVNYLNNKLACLETINHKYYTDNLLLQSQIIRLQNIIDSYNNVEDNTNINKIINPLELYEFNEMKINKTTINKTFKNENILLLHEKIQHYYIKHHSNNTTLNNNISEYNNMINDLKLKIHSLNNEISKLNNLLNIEISNNKALTNKYNDVITYYNIKLNNKNYTFLYKYIYQLKTKIFSYQSKIQSLESLLLAGTYHTNPIISKFAKIVVKQLDILKSSTYKEMNERYLMKSNDFPILIKGTTKKSTKKKNNSPLVSNYSVKKATNTLKSRISPPPASNDSKYSTKVKGKSNDASLDNIESSKLKSKNKSIENFLPDIKNKTLNVNNDDASLDSSNESSKNENKKTTTTGVVGRNEKATNAKSKGLLASMMSKKW